jgi:hypothetical protein
MRKDARIQLFDVEGDPHDYYLDQHPGREGKRLLVKLEKGLSGSIIGFTVEQLSSLLEMLLDDERFMLDLFKYTTRDGRKLSEPEIDMAYQGNYGEMLDAMAWVVMENFLGPLLKWGQTLNAKHPLAPHLDRVTALLGKDTPE